MELEVTFGRAVRVWWAFFWRNLIGIFVAMVLGGFLGGVAGFIIGMLGGSPNTVRIIVAPFSLVLGLFISVVPMWLILGKSFGKFRLVLISTEPPVLTTPAPSDAVSAQLPPVPPLA